MTDFDPERFESEKYAEYFTELQQAYKRAFDRMNDRFDSTLVHAIDQQVLNESEPFYEDGRFVIELPEDPSPMERVRGAGAVVDEDKLEEVLDIYTDELRAELRRAFDLDAEEQ